jgi:hypothetical protein
VFAALTVAGDVKGGKSIHVTKWRWRQRADQFRIFLGLVWRLVSLTDLFISYWKCPVSTILPLNCIQSRIAQFLWNLIVRGIMKRNIFFSIPTLCYFFSIFPDSSSLYCFKKNWPPSPCSRFISLLRLIFSNAKFDCVNCVRFAWWTECSVFTWKRILNVQQVVVAFREYPRLVSSRLNMTLLTRLVWKHLWKKFHSLFFFLRLCEECWVNLAVIDLSYRKCPFPFLNYEENVSVNDCET